MNVVRIQGSDSLSVTLALSAVEDVLRTECPSHSSPLSSFSSKRFAGLVYLCHVLL